MANDKDNLHALVESLPEEPVEAATQAIEGLLRYVPESNISAEAQGSGVALPSAKRETG